MEFNSSSEFNQDFLGKGLYGKVYHYGDKAIKQYHIVLYKYDLKNPCLKLNKKKFKLMKARASKIKNTPLIEDLLYINGEFYIASSTDDTIVKKKKTKQEAKNMYLEYFMKYQSGSIKVDEKPNIELQEKNIEKDMTIDEKRLEDSSQKEVVSSLDTKEIEIEIPSSDEKRSEKLRE